MAGNIKQDYEDAKGIVDNMHRELGQEKLKLSSLSDKNQIDAQKKKISSLEKYLEEWESERDKLKHQVEEIQKKEQLAEGVAMIPGEGTLVGGMMAVQTKRDSSKLSRKAGKKMSGLQDNMNKKLREIEAAETNKAKAQSNNNSSYNSNKNKGNYSDGNAGLNYSSPSPQLNHNSSGSGNLSKFWNFIKPKGGSKEETELPRLACEFIILLAILAHLVDAFWLSFSISPAAIGYRIMLYFILGIFVHLILNRGWSTYESIIEIIKVSAIPLFIVPLISIVLNMFSVSADIIKIISTITLAFPIWLYYILYMRNKKPIIIGNIANKAVNLFFTPSGWAKIWFFVLAILLLFNIMTFLGTAISGGSSGGLLGGDSGIPGLSGGIFGGIPGAENSGFNVQTSIEGLTSFLSTSVNKMYSSITSFFKGASNGFADLKNQTMGQYYTGQVEQNKEQTGVFITDFHVTGKQYDSVPVVAYGYIKARSFVEGITIYPSCYAQSMTNKSKKYEGTVDPTVFENMYIEDQRGVLCTFENYGFDLGGSSSGTLPADRYQIFLVLDFKFETWAYKQYYFIDRNYLIYLKTNGLNPNTKLQIPQKTKTIYTNGPVMMGMDDKVEMPFAISSESTNYLPVGMTIDDKPQTYGVKGQVMKVYSYTLRMPRGFQISRNGDKYSCTVPNPIESADPNVSNYMIYTFNVDPNLNLAGSYMTLNCNIEIPKESVVSILPGANTPAIVSIVGTVTYDYRLTKQIPVTVEKTPGT